jgi:hypothetical protein
MNYQQWLKPLLKIARDQNLFNMFGKKRKSNSFWWISLIGISLSAVALFRLKDTGKVTDKGNVTHLLNNVKENRIVDIQKYLTDQDRALAAEMAAEFIPDKPQLDPPKNDNL